MLIKLYHRAFFLFFLIIDLYFLVPAVIVQIFNLNAKLINEANAEIGTQPLTVETKTKKYSK